MASSVPPDLKVNMKGEKQSAGEEGQQGSELREGQAGGCEGLGETGSGL